jgi:hypothetical protein
VFRGKREQEKVAMSTATELKRHLQKAAAEVQEEQDKAKKKGPTTGQKVLRGGLAALGGGAVGLAGGGALGYLGSNALFEKKKEDAKSHFLSEWEQNRAKTPLGGLFMPPTEVMRPVIERQLQNDPMIREKQQEVQAAGTAGGAALGAGGGALLGLALYLAFRRTGG